MSATITTRSARVAPEKADSPPALPMAHYECGGTMESGTHERRE